MTLLLGCALGLGVLLSIAPLLWPRGSGRAGRGAGEGIRSPRPRVARRWSPVPRIRERMNQAGLGAVSVSTLLVVSVILGAVVAALTLAFVPVVVLAVATGAAALLAPMLVIGWRAGRRRRESRDVWPDAVDHLVSALRAGLALPDAVSSLAHSGPTRVRDAFAEFERDYRTTTHFDRCLDRLKDRLADPVADRILETVRMAREVGGGELPSVLRGLASYLRQDAAVRGEVEARQSWVRNAARLGAAAPWVVLLLLATRPEAAIAYNSPTGAVLIVAGFGVTVLAYRLMVAIARLPEERRWFR